MSTLIQTKDMKLNTSPVLVDYSQSTQTSQSTQGYNVITITPKGNYSADAQINYGSSSLNQNIPSGSPVVYPIVQKFNNSTVEVKNINQQENTSFYSGWYALSQSPDKKLTNSNTEVNQYKSIGSQTSSGMQTLSLTARSTSATLAIVIVGGNEPLLVFLNTDKSNLPPAWQDLDNCVYESGNTYQESKNYYGQTMYIVNTSLTTDASFDARIQ